MPDFSLGLRSHRSPWACQRRISRSSRLVIASLPQYFSLRLILHPILYPLGDFWLSSFVCVSKGDRHLFYLSALSDLSLGEFSDTYPRYTSNPLRPLLFVHICPSHSLHRPPVPAILASQTCNNSNERNRGNELYHHRFAVCSITAARLSPNLRNLPKLSHTLLAKLHIPTFTPYSFPYPFPALISLCRTPNERIPGRFASYPSYGFDIEMMKALSLLRSISGHPSPPSHAPSFSGSRGPCRWSRSQKSSLVSKLLWHNQLWKR